MMEMSYGGVSLKITKVNFNCLLIGIGINLSDMDYEINK